MTSPAPGAEMVRCRVRHLFVLTHHVPDEVPQGTSSYTFVTDGIERAVALARTAAGSKDVHVMGAGAVQECLRAGLLDEIGINLIPLLLGGGVRLLDHIDPTDLELQRVVDAPGVTHLTYSVVKERAARVTSNA